MEQKRGVTRLTVVVGGAEGAISHTPARREDDKVGDGYSRAIGLGCKHGEDRRILMCVDRREG